MNVSRAPLDDVETLSESLEMVTVTSLPEEEESIQESHGDVVTATPEFPHDGVEENLEEENDDKSAKAKLISMTTILMICTNILCTRQIF